MITVTSVKYCSKLKTIRLSSGLQVFTQHGLADILYKDGDHVQTLTVHMHPTYMTDGATTRFPVSLVVPSWKKDNHRWNLAPVVHDGLYMHKGFGIFTREECDDFLRGIWREAGMSRIVAGAADVAVCAVAGGKKHWGSDEHNVRDKFTASINGKRLLCLTNF